MRVLLFSPVNLGAPGQVDCRHKISRVAQLKRALEVLGNAVEVHCVPGPAGSQEDGYTTAGCAPYPQARLIEEKSPDVVIYGAGWEHCLLTTKTTVPVVVDLFCHAVVASWVRCLEGGKYRFLDVIRLADRYIVSNKNALLFYSGWLVQSGLVPESRSTLSIVSACPADLGSDLAAVLNRDLPQSPAKVLFWINAGTHAVDTEERTIPNSLRDAAANLGWDLQVYCRGALSGPSLKVGICLGFDTLISELDDNIFLLEAVSAGMPIIVGPRHPMAQAILESNAGWVIDPEAEISPLLSQISDQEIVDRSKAARAFAQKCFPIEVTSLELGQSLEGLGIRNVEGNLYQPGLARPCVFAPSHSQSNSQPMKIGSEIKRVKILFHNPLDTLSGIRIFAKDLSPSVLELAIELRTNQGRLLVHRSLQTSDMSNMVAFPIPRWRNLSGGEILEFSILPKWREDGGSSFSLRGTKTLSYPVISVETFSEAGAIESSTSGVWLEFVPGDGPVWGRALKLGRRAWGLVKNGEWKRFTRAIVVRCKMIYSRWFH